MKRNKLKIIVCLLVLASLGSCTSVYVIRHPDYNFLPTIPSSVMIYDGFTPTYPFIIIGRMTIDETWTASRKEWTRKIQEKAASIGGNAVIITDKDVDIVAFNSSASTGTVTATGNSLNYYAITRDTSTYIPIVKLYGYVIKRRFSHIADGNSFKDVTTIVRVIKNENYITYTIRVGTSEILVLTRADACDISWLKEGIDVKMFYSNDDDIHLSSLDGNNKCKFRRIK